MKNVLVLLSFDSSLCTIHVLQKWFKSRHSSLTLLKAFKAQGENRSCIWEALWTVWMEKGNKIGRD